MVSSARGRGSASSELHRTYSRGIRSNSNTNTAMKRRAAPGRGSSPLAMSDRLTDRDLESVKLDPSTLDESEKKRVDGIRAIQSKMAEVDAKKQQLRNVARDRNASQGMEDNVPVLEAVAGDDGLTDEERRKAEGLASIERSLAEVTAIQRQLGIKVDEDEDEKDLEVVDTAWRGQAGLDVSDSTDGDKSWGVLADRKGLVVGDLVALTLFAYIGRASHGMAAFDLGVLVTALPFFVGWFSLSPLLGAYTKTATATAGDAAKSLVPAWGVSIPFAIFLRALSKGGEVPPLPFAITTMVFTFVALLGWREVYTAFNPTGEGDKQAGILDGFRMITTLLQRW